MPKVFPRCQSGKIPEYIDVEGSFFPCCWIANEPYITGMREFLGSDYQTLNLKSQSKVDIKSGPAWEKIKASWEDGTCWPCVRFCDQDYEKLDRVTRNIHEPIPLIADSNHG